VYVYATKHGSRSRETMSNGWAKNVGIVEGNKGHSDDVYPLETSTMDKGKEVSLQAWGGPEGSRKLRFPDFMTTAHDGGKVVSLTHQPPLPQEIHLVLISVRG